MATKLLRLPDGFPTITAGLRLPEGTLVTGHSNGYVTLWKGEEPHIILRASSEVHAIHRGPSGDLYVGCNEGDLHRLWGPSFKDSERVLPATSSKHDRVFRLLELKAGRVLFTSTYGVVKILERENGEWRYRALHGHSNAVFAVAVSDDSHLATGDYRGAIIIWKPEKKSYTAKAQLRIPSYVSGLVFHGPRLLGAIGQNGVFYLFERQDDDTWRVVFESEASSGRGAAIASSAVKDRLVAATAQEIFDIDPSSQVLRSSGVVKSAIAVFPEEDWVYVLTGTGLTKLLWNELEVKHDLVQYEYLKVNLLGNTGSGKTTLSSALTTGDPGAHQSTYGRRIWTWKVDGDPVPRRVLINDNGGQEQVIGTLLPLVADSDLALFFFRKTDHHSLLSAIALHDRLRPLLNPHAKSYLVQTFIDQDLAAVTTARLRRALQESEFDGVLEVAANDPDSVADFQQQFLAQLDWSQARNAVQSTALASLTELMEDLKSKDTRVLNVNDIKKKYEERTSQAITVNHLKFLLKSLTDAGQIEYYPRIGDRVVIQDPDFNRLRTNIPIMAQDEGGLVDWTEVETRFEHPTYVAMLDVYYTGSGIALDIGKGQRLFPAFLEDRPLKIPDQIAAHLPPSSLQSLTFPTREPQISTLLEALFDLKLDHHQIALNEGLFSWGTNAYLYYQISASHGALEGSRLTIKYNTGGPNQATADRLAEEFGGLLQALYGPPLPSGG